MVAVVVTRGQSLPLRAALVRDHRRTGLGQDHGPGELGPAVSALLDGGRARGAWRGGTRHCDWWFTDEAVLIDTAGRYTTQASDAEVDARAWQGFLGLLKRSRPRQPISGVLVTVSVPDLLMLAAPERAAHALAIRRRVQELHEHLGIRFPIYLLVTKCDLLAGFTDYLGDIDKAQRATPWGFTFALDRDMRSDLTSYRAEFEALEQRLHDGLIARLQSEREPQRRARIYAFPQQFAGMRDVLHGFLEQVFSPSAYEQHPMLRGVYFVSGTQEGTPIDRMLGRIARSFDLAADPAVAAIPGQGKSYSRGKLRELVFAEGGLAGTNLRWERRRGAMAGLGYLAIALVLCLAVAAWSLSYVNNQRYLDQVAQGLDRAEQLAASAPPVSADPRPLLPRLQAALDLPRPPASTEGPSRLLLGFGLYQGDKLAAASRQAYQELLEHGLLGSIAARIDQRLRSGGTDEQRYEALKAYLMLRDPEHLDWQALRQQVLADWGATLPRDTTAEQLGALASHLEALVALGPSTAGLAVDQDLVADTQQRLRGTAMAARLYQRLRQQGVGPGIAGFSPERSGGAQTTLVFRRASGAPMSQAIPALYTAEGYHQGFQQQVSGVAGQLIDEQTWVLGMPAVPSSDTARKALADQARRLYLSDYAKVWEALLADLKLVQPRSLVDAIQTARILSASDTPLVPLLRDISRQTTLARPAEGVVAKAESLVGSLAEQSRRALDNAFRAAGRGGSTAESSVAIEEQLVDSRFAALRQHVSAPGGQGPAPIDATVTLLNEVYSFLSAADTAIRAGNTPPPSPVPDRVKAEGARAPEPIRSMLTGLTVTGGSMASGATRVNLGREVDAQIGEFCRSAVNGRYPFARGSDRDVTQEDFAQLFAPNGRFDEFFQQRLQPFVDTSRRPWRFREASGTSMGARGAVHLPAGRGDPRSLLSRRGERASTAARVSPGHDGPVDQAVHPRRRRAGGALCPRAGTAGHDHLAGQSRGWPGAGGGVAALAERSLGDGHQRSLGPVPPLRQDADRARPGARAVPRDLRRRRAQGEFRSHHQQRAQSVPHGRAPGLQLSFGPLKGTSTWRQHHRVGTASSRRSATSPTVDCRPRW